MNRQTGWVLTAAFVALLLVFFSMPRANAADAAPTQTALAAAQAQLKATQTQIDALNHLLDAIPPELTDVAALAKSLKSPEAAFTFVRDQIAYEPYRGVQKGAWGTLVTRGGNDLDKALLLAALLRAQNLDVSIAHGKVDATTAQKLMAEAAARPDALSLALKALKVPAADVAVGPSEKDFSTLLAAGVKRRRDAMHIAVDRAYGELSGKAPQPPSAAAPAASDHYWVQAKIGDKEESFDPSLGANAPGTALAAATDSFDPDSLPDELYQTVRFTVVAAYLDGGKLTQKNVLDATLRTVDILGKPLRLVIAPKTQNPAANDFQAQLLANADTTDGDVFQLHTESKPQKSGGGGMFGGLGGLSGGGASPPPKKTGKGPVLSRLWLDVVESAPGEQTFKIRRIVLDRLNGVGNALAAGQSDALARRLLVQIWDGAADAGAFAAPFVLRTQNDELASIRVGGGATLDATIQGGQVAPDNLPQPVLSGAIVNLFFASDLARHFIGEKIGAQMRSYYRMPRLAFIRRGFRVADWGAVDPRAVYAEDVDLLDPPLAFTGSATAAREFALRAGITDTALEAQATTVHPRLGTLAVFAALPGDAAPKRYTKVSALPDHLPPPILAALREDVASGNIVVAPPTLVAVNGVQAYGWWSFTSGTPYALGKMDLGGGQSMMETAQLNKEIFDATLPYLKFYGNCLRCYMGSVASVLAGGGPAQPTGLNRLVPGNQKQFVNCMIGAICTFVSDLTSQLLGDLASFGEKQFEKEEIKTLDDLLLKFALHMYYGHGSGAAVGAGANAAKNACQAGMRQAAK
ncbi:MAG: hypothetical protein ACRETC_07210 [Gammaproteobacteria bacterium]